MESDQDIATTVLGFLSTFNEGSVGIIGIIGTIRIYGNRRDRKAHRAHRNHRDHRDQAPCTCKALKGLIKVPRRWEDGLPLH
jgi:hypothetical protein